MTNSVEDGREQMDVPEGLQIISQGNFMFRTRGELLEVRARKLPRVRASYSRTLMGNRVGGRRGDVLGPTSVLDSVFWEPATDPHRPKGPVPNP